ncbi:MAG: leucine--tRNA ligase [Pseudopedobacter saltans]|uniref:Leucine--tRNA ligase n=1 Tax=Pseudopedobacter saltans TaxID=151895 RepID=A0A2W5EUP5_9SPHI|nr:MAG: leucine--tRNA ligase [Pseudopedobacter saltans]
MEYNFNAIEKKWQQKWNETHAYQVKNDFSKPKYYVLDMFPYPSGAGLHVGHPLGYISTDIFARYKRLKGFNVLHPMGYDAFGLPAEQYAIEHGIHPAISTEQNINNFRKQLDNIGFSFDWSREVRTSDPSYYKWTQWIFLQLFKSWYNKDTNKAEYIDQTLIPAFEKEGSKIIDGRRAEIAPFTAEEWKHYSPKEKNDILMQFRLAFCDYGIVNWCEALGTVLANDEVINGVSERGGYPVEKKKLRQWYLRITEYADRLLEGLQTVDFSDAMKEMQSNWIGRSQGAEIDFKIKSEKTSDEILTVYTTRPDTIFGVDFMVVAPELDLIDKIKSEAQTQAVDEYIAYVKSRSERERQAEKKVTGCFTGAYAINPFNGKEIPIYTAEYVLAGYGTGAVMAVPCGDERDYKFAKQFDLPVTNILGDKFDGENANATKDAILENSDFVTGKPMKEATELILGELEKRGIGKRKVNFRMRDAAFSRQRFWGEPIPIKWIDGVAIPLDESQLPLQLPEVEHYNPGPEGQGPLANVKEWTDEYLETNTMPGYAGSSWYFLRYMDPHNDQTFCDRQVSDYWNQVDIYLGGTEHAVGHLLYSRLWTKILFDLGYIGFQEPYKRLVNQGMIQGRSAILYRMINTSEKVDELFKDDHTIKPTILVSAKTKSRIIEKQGFTNNDIDNINKLYSSYTKSKTIEIKNATFDPIRIPIDFVNDEILIDKDGLKKWRYDFKNVEFLNESDGKFYLEREVEKMSKSKFNTANPDELVNKYGADTFRMYEMFLGPVEQSKPWETKGIEGVHRFLKKLWRLVFDEERGAIWKDEPANDAELKTLHKTIKKVGEDIERFSLNTVVSAFMVAVNELTDLKCHKRSVIEPLVILLTPYAPHIAEEIWHTFGNETSILDATFPTFEEKYLKESSKNYPVSINGKMRANIEFALDADKTFIEETVLANETIAKWIDGKPVKKFIFVPGKMINVVI